MNIRYDLSQHYSLLPFCNESYDLAFDIKKTENGSCSIEIVKKDKNDTVESTEISCSCNSEQCLNIVRFLIDNKVSYVHLFDVVQDMGYIRDNI